MMRKYLVSCLFLFFTIVTQAQLPAKVINCFMNKLLIIFISSLFLTACQEGELSLESNSENSTEELVEEEDIRDQIDTNFRAGDIIFHRSSTTQSMAIQLATNSPFSHVGIIYEQDGQPYVFEAVQPVKITPLRNWIARGVDKTYVLKRWKEELSEAELQEMYKLGQTWLGKNYDLDFAWSDDRMYCSELVYKLYKRVAEVELGELKALKERNLSNPLIQKALNRRYGKNNWPLDRKMISPGDLFESDELILVREG